ncbi:MAG: rhomboid family intramembrane serine protease [Endomicrobiales bacterium]
MEIIRTADTAAAARLFCILLIVPAREQGDRMIPLMDTIPRRFPPLMTWLLMTVNAMVFLAMLGLPPAQLERLVYAFGMVPAQYFRPELAADLPPAAGYWPFVTYMFLHGGWGHIIINMWVLMLFGDNVEDRMGHLRFLIFYLVSGLSAISIQVMTGPSSVLPTIGASGAVAGVMGAYFVLFPQSRIITLIPILFIPYFVEIPAVVYLLLWFMLQLFSGAATALTGQAGGGIAFWAHIGGFLSGAALYRLFIGRMHREFYDDEYRPW